MLGENQTFQTGQGGVPLSHGPQETGPAHYPLDSKEGERKHHMILKTSFACHRPSRIRVKNMISMNSSIRQTIPAGVSLNDCLFKEIFSDNIINSFYDYRSNTYVGSVP
jgi:hypothetical protein